MDTCSSKDQSFHKGAIYMVPKPNLGGDSIYTLRLVHPRPRRTSHKENWNSSRALAPTIIHPNLISQLIDLQKFFNLKKIVSFHNLAIILLLAREFATPLASLGTQQKEAWGTTPIRAMIFWSTFLILYGTSVPLLKTAMMQVKESLSKMRAW